MRVTLRPFPTAPAALPVPPPDEVHVWQAPLDPPPLPPDALEAALIPAERERAERYRHPRARDQFVRGRGLLRVLLARYLGCDPRAVPIILGQDGKPVHAPADGSEPLPFNLAHTDGLAVFAVAARPVGVDVETVREVPTADGLVERFFSPAEREQYRRLPAQLRPAAFLRGWTCKEAVLKGIGCGARGLDRCAVDLDPRRPPRVLAPADGWALACWEPADGYVAAVALAVG